MDAIQCVILHTDQALETAGEQMGVLENVSRLF